MTEVLKPYLFLALLILLAFVAILIIRTAVRRRQRQQAFSLVGRQGEEELFEELTELRGRFRRKRLLCNLYLPCGEEGQTTEVDIVMICRSGIYVFENKNYTGDVMGDEDAREWYQSNVNGNSFYFYNPIAQNWAHVNALMRCLRIDNPELLKSVIVFNSACSLRRVKTHGDDFLLVKAGKLGRVLRKLAKRGKNLLRREDIEYFYEELQPYTQVSRRIKKEHIRQVKSK